MDPANEQILRTSLVVALLWLMSAVGLAEEVKLNLKNADIQSLIATVSQITGKNFIVDPRVKGKVTVIASHPMEPSEVYEVFLSVLRVHGFSAVPTGAVIKIVPEANAKQDSIPTLGQQFDPGIQEGRDQSVTLVIPLQNVNAAQLVPVLRPLVPPQGHLAAYAPTNVLIVSDRAANVDRLSRIVEKVDRASEAEVEVVALEHASSAEVVRILSTLIPRAGSPEATGSVQVVADERTNSVIMSGERADRIRYRTSLPISTRPLKTGGNTHVIYLRYATAADLVSLLQGVSGSIAQAAGEGGGQLPQSQAKVDIQADETTNALVVTAPPDMLRTIKQVIAQLDIRRAQVLIEAVIADITSERAKTLGVNWVISGGDQSPGAVGIINLGGGIGDALGTIDGDVDGGVGIDDLGIIPSGTTVGVGSLSGFLPVRRYHSCTGGRWRHQPAVHADSGDHGQRRGRDRGRRQRTLRHRTVYEYGCWRRLPPTRFRPSSVRTSD